MSKRQHEGKRPNEDLTESIPKLANGVQKFAVVAGATLDFTDSPAFDSKD